MSHELEQLRDAALAEIAAATDEQTLEAARVRYLGRAGSISAWADRMKSLSKEERPVVGKLLNEARNAVTAAIEQSAERLRAAKEASELANIDISLPGTAAELGALHPLTQMLDRGIGIFRRMGFALAEGPGCRNGMALLRRAQHRARSSGAKRAGHILSARWPPAPHPHLHRADSHDGKRAAADPRHRARRGLSPR